MIGCLESFASNCANLFRGHGALHADDPKSYITLNTRVAHLVDRYVQYEQGSSG